MQKSLSQKCWEWIIEQPDFHSTDLAREMQVSMPKVKTVMDEFIRRGHVEAANTSAKPYVYKATSVIPSFNRSRPNSHPPKNARQRIWQAMRFFNGQFTVAEVVSAASTNRANVTRFISDLIKYRYIARTRGQWILESQSQARECRYLLIENTGRIYPVIRKNGLWDQNLKRLIPLPEIKKEQR